MLTKHQQHENIIESGVDISLEKNTQIQCEQAADHQVKGPLQGTLMKRKAMLLVKQMKQCIVNFREI